MLFWILPCFKEMAYADDVNLIGNGMRTIERNADY